MKANIINGDATTFHTLLYGVPDNKVLNYLETQMTSLNNYIGEKSNWLLDRGREIYNTFSSSDAIRRIKENIFINGTSVNGNTITPLQYDDIFNPSPIMKRYTMVCPDLYSLYRKQRCNGYNGVFVDVDPTVTEPEWKLDYMAVNNGICRTDKEELYAEIFCSEDLEDLSFSEQVAIRQSWKLASKIMALGLDPTDEHRNEL